MEIYKTNGVCAKEIGVEVENGILRKVKFFGCCDGDSKAFEILLRDMEINKIINDLYHIECRERGTKKGNTHFCFFSSTQMKR